jgi:SAM-dependent methyltransferase
MREDLLAALWCPDDHGDLQLSGAAVECRSCSRRYPVIDGVVSFLAEAELTELDRREQQDRDAEAEWYDSLWPEYIDKLELPAHARPLGATEGPVLDIGAGPGRVTEHLARDLGLPTIALDYSLHSLRLLVRRCEGLPVLAVHGDARSLPLRDRVVTGATAAQCYEHLRPPIRRALLGEVGRVLRPGARFAVSTFNYNLTFRLWKLKGNKGAREGNHMYGSDYYYVRQTPKEFRTELAEVFTDIEIHGIRSIPARSMGTALRRVGGAKVGDRFTAFMTKTGYKLDELVARTPLSFVNGFLLLATVSGPKPVAAGAPRQEQAAQPAG